MYETHVCLLFTCGRCCFAGVQRLTCEPVRMMSRLRWTKRGQPLKRQWKIGEMKRCELASDAFATGKGCQLCGESTSAGDATDTDELYLPYSAVLTCLEGKASALGRSVEQ